MDLLTVVLTALLSAAALFLISKLLGHKQVAQLDLFDYINGITIGSIAAELATELENPLRPLIAMFVYGALAYTLDILTSRCPRSRKFVNGTPTIVMHAGRIYYENLKKAKLDMSEFLLMCRQQGYFDLGAVETAVFEYNGRLSILPVAARRPATPQDLNLAPPKETFYVELILDGRVLHDNLQRAGRDLKWLETQLRAQGCKGPKEILLAVCDENGALSLYKYE